MRIVFRKNTRRSILLILLFGFFVIFGVRPSDVMAEQLNYLYRGSNMMYACAGTDGSYAYEIPWPYSGFPTCDTSRGGYYLDAVKLINNELAFCVQWKASVNTNYYKIDTSWSDNSKTAVLAGRIIDVMYSNNYNDQVKNYMVGSTSLNSLFSKLGDAKSMYFSRYQLWIDNAYDFYKNIYKPTTKLPNVNISIPNKTMKLSGSNFISDKITISGLLNLYGDSADYVTYVIRATASNGGSVSLCDNSNGTSCHDSITINKNNYTDSVNVYLSVAQSAITSNDTVTININGSNKSNYPTTVRYVPADGMSQYLLVYKRKEVSRSISQSASLVVPNLLNHTITGIKVNEYGDKLNGATLEIYKDDTSVSANLLASNNGSGSTVKYVSGLAAENDDDFFNHDYYLVEKVVPDGYVLSSAVNKFYLTGSVSSGVSKVCYYNGGTDSSESEVANNERCNFANYDYMCLSSEGEYVNLNDTGNCEFSASELVETVGDVGDETGEDAGDETGGEEPEETPEVTYEKVCYNKGNNSTADESYCSDKGNYILVTSSNGNLVVTQVNKKNTIKISKQAITGDEEVSGARLKICTASSYNESGSDCEAAKTIEDIEMSWVSTSNPYEFFGIPKGEYYIVEVTPPAGYIRAVTATKFEIDETGKVTTGDKTITNEDFIKNNGAIVVKNELTSMSVSKQDMATSNEVPGASLSICLTEVDENGDIKVFNDQYTGECVEATLADGSSASWISTDEPKKIVGLPIGTYYLVEKIAPTDYSTAESILFTLNADGTLSDKDGNSLADSKLIMHDERIGEVKTGALTTYIVITIMALVACLGVGSYYYLNRVKGVVKVNNDNKKIRKRKIHKK